MLLVMPAAAAALNEPFHDGLRPIRLTTLLVRRCPHPVFLLGVDALLSPCHEDLRNVLIHGNALADASVLHGPAVQSTTEPQG
jgi:hypothetical protein